VVDSTALNPNALRHRPPDDRILEIARELVQGYENVIADVERLAARLPEKTPIDCEGFCTIMAIVLNRKSDEMSSAIQCSTIE
jgi:hypothetical protein